MPQVVEGAKVARGKASTFSQGLRRASVSPSALPRSMEASSTSKVAFVASGFLGSKLTAAGEAVSGSWRSRRR